MREMRARSINPPVSSQVTQSDIDVPAGGRDPSARTGMPADDACLEDVLRWAGEDSARCLPTASTGRTLCV